MPRNSVQFPPYALCLAPGQIGVRASARFHLRLTASENESVGELRIGFPAGRDLLMLANQIGDSAVAAAAPNSNIAPANGNGQVCASPSTASSRTMPHQFANFVIQCDARLCARGMGDTHRALGSNRRIISAVYAACRLRHFHEPPVGRTKSRPSNAI